MIGITYDEYGNPIYGGDYGGGATPIDPGAMPDNFSSGNLPGTGGAPTGPYPGYAPYGGPMRPDLSFLQDAPSFDFHYDPFAAPTLEQAAQEPGYEFSRAQGEQAIRNNEASLGRLRGGATLKALADYNRNAATQNYTGVFNRALQAYGTNFNNAFQTAKEAFAPKLETYRTRMQFGGQAAQDAFTRAWQAYQDAQNRAYDQWKTQYTAGLPPTQ